MDMMDVLPSHTLLFAWSTFWQTGLVRARFHWPGDGLVAFSTHAKCIYNSQARAPSEGFHAIVSYLQPYRHK
ncbi:hypothetical protein B0I35DRAFT_126393 [Stachybotrys elegans]|uniref:Uncharacterized protein n=1 Tax=Stachybotrys elegans TaxID=80388 RepID=A0A8K0T0B8_9HYPO|nr:hypothetical protein B0I35DRAFT_126393 [Stachybotrys elegans]